jgi:uncharacterized repeat protein (TIGR03803 family)
MKAHHSALMRLLFALALVLPTFLAQAQSNAVLTTLHSFAVFPNGATPTAGLVQASDGNYFGTTANGGTSNSGTVFKISTNGALTTLYSFTGGNDGANPSAAVTQGTDGNFYGTTPGTVFQISPTGVLKTLDSGLAGPSALARLDGFDPPENFFYCASG